jgi:hypothetical protein
MAFEEFTGELDGPTGAAAFVPFDGELDAAPVKVTAKPGAKPEFADDYGDTVNNPDALGPQKRESVLEGQQIPVLPFNAEEANRLSRRSYAEQAQRDSQNVGRPVMREGQAQPEDVNVGRGSRLKDSSMPVRAAAKAISGGVQGLGGVVRAAGDLVGVDEISNFGKAAASGAGSFEAGMGESGPIEGFGPKSPVPYLKDMAEGAGSSLAQSAALATMFGPAGVIPAMSIMTSGQEYQQARQQGLDPAMALAGAIPKGIFEAVGEKFTGLDKVAGAMGTLLQKGASDTAKRTAGEVLVRAGIKEIPGEVLTYLGQTGTDLIPGIGLQQDMTMQDFVNGLRDTVVQSGMMGLTFAGGGHAALPRNLKPLISPEALMRQKWGPAPAAPVAPAPVKVDPVAEISKATTVDEAITAAKTSMQSSSAVDAIGNILANQGLASTPTQQAQAAIKSIEATPAEAANVSMPTELPGVPAGTPGSGFTEFTGSLDIGGGLDGPAGPAVVPGLAGDQSDSGAVPLADGGQTGAVAPVDIAQAATNSIANVQDKKQGTGPGTEAQAAPSQAPAAVGSNAAPAQDLPGAGSAAVESAGVKPADQRLIPVSQRKASPAATVITGKKLDGDWREFSTGSGTLNIPRAEMPQIKAEHRGAMVNFLNARDIAHTQEEVPADSLKPTQTEFSPEKVEKALGFTGTDRSILVSSDNHVLDGHHQWMAKLNAGEPVKVIRLDAPIKQLLDVVREFPSAEVAPGAVANSAAPVSQPQGEEVSRYTGKFGKGMGKDAAKLEAQRLNRTADGIIYTAEEHGDPKMENQWAVVGREVSESKQSPARTEYAQAATENVAPAKTKKPQGGKTLRAAAYDKNPLMTFLATHGLFHDKAKPNSHKSEFSPDKGIMVMGYGPVFKKTGKRLDALTQNAIEEGYLPKNGTEDQLRELIRRAVAGEKIAPLYADGVAEQVAEQSFAEHLAQQQEAAQDEDFDPLAPLTELEITGADIAQSDYDSLSPELQLEVNALIAYAEERGIDADLIKEEAANETHGQPQDAYLQAAKRALTEAIEKGDRGSSADSGSQGNALEQGSQDGLIAPTREDVLAQQDRAAAATKAEAKDATDTANKAKADAERNEFTLTGSDRAADVAAAGGQQDIFGGVTEDDVAPVRQSIEDMRRKLVDLENRIVGAAGMAPGFIEDAMKSRKVPAELKQQRNDLREKMREERARVDDAPKANSGEVPFTYINGDRAEYTGKTEMLHGGLFYEVKFTEGTKEGKTGVTQRAPDGTNPGQRGPEKSSGIVTPQIVPKKSADPVAETKATLDANNITGKERLDVLKDVKAGTLTVDEVKEAYPTKIEDAGEKIGGARKDRWKDRGLDLTDLDGMSEAEGAELATKANVWKPDYEAMAEATEPVTAAMVKTVYDQLAAQPKKNTPEGRRNYVTMMQAVRKAYSEAKSPEDVKQAGDKVKRAIGIYTDDPEAKKQAREVLFSVYKGRSDPFVLGYNELSKAKKLVEDGFPAKGEPWKKRLTLRASGGRGLTPRGIELTLEESAALGTPLTKEQVADGFYRISTKDGKAVGYAPTKADAEATAKTIYERDLKKGASDKVEPSRPNLDSLKREGLPKRTDRDVSADDFVKDFGFRGVEFGNWAAQDERQRIINMAYDGLMDLAEIMGLPPKALSLNGTMGMAFGARGGGKFAAHYEPGKLVINMTKINGGGSMAHEWAHALDHYFGELNQKDAYTTKARGASGWMDEQQYKGLPRTRMEKDAEGKWANVTKMRLDNLRPEMAKAFDEVMSALFSGQETKAQMVRSEELAIERYQALADKESDPEMKAVYLNGIKSRQQALEELRKDPEDKMYPKGRSNYAGQAQALSGKSTTGYWLRPTEMFARAFESWVFDKVAAMGARSDYLVHGVEEDRFAGGGYKGNPYPTGQERATINAAFDKLASTIKTKETDKGVAMFSRGKVWRSALQDGIEALNVKAQGADGWRAQIQGLVNKGTVKADEVEWSGVTDWLKMQTGKVSKEQLHGFLKSNGVQVQETVLSDADARALPEGWSIRETDDHDGFGTPGYEVLDSDGEVMGQGKTREDALQEAQDDDALSDSPAAPKYEQYTLPGGENYREVLLTLPPQKPKAKQYTYAEAEHQISNFQNPVEVRDGAGKFVKNITSEWALNDNKAKIDSGEYTLHQYIHTTDKDTYKSSHWDERNVLAHIRVNDRTDADGNKVLFVEEIQSDWGQDGKKRGIQGAIPTDDQVRQYFGLKDGADPADYRQEMMDMNQKGVPNAPFIGKTDAWVSLALKRIVKMAVDGGYDKVAFANGEQSAKRYSLAKQIDSMIVGKEDDGSYSLVAQQGGRDVVKRDNVPAGELEGLVGKEMAQRIIDGGGKDIGHGEREFAGLDLKVGGEGMKAFYDKIVPSVAKDVLRKLGGGKMESVAIPDPNGTGRRMPPSHNPMTGRMDDGYAIDDEPAWQQTGFTITDAMREKASDGVPLFALGADAFNFKLQPRQGMSTVESLQAAVADLIGGKQLPNKLGRVVAATSGDIKATWEPLIGKQGLLQAEDPEGDALAFYDPATKTVFLMADRIPAGDETAILVHELMHKHGQAALGKAGWDRLHGVIGTWENAEPGSEERRVYDYAAEKVEAAGQELSNQELFPYAVEGALKMGIKPSMAAKRGTVAHWLESVRQHLKVVWDKITAKPGDFKAQDLVNLAFGIAQMENPESRAKIEGFASEKDAGLKAFSKLDDIYALPKSESTDLEQIARDNGEEVKVRTTNLGSEKMHTLTFKDGTVIRITERPANPYGQDQQVYGMEIDDYNYPKPQQVGRPGENPEDVPPTDDVWLDVSQNTPAKYGAKAYNIAATYAHNTGKIFIGDPAGLSDKALRRRTDQMLASALKFGTTEHLAPHPRQVAGDEKLGVPPLKWVYGDHTGNVERMIDVTLDSLENGSPGAQDDTRYDPTTGGFTDKSGKAVPRKSAMGRDMATYRAGVDKAQAGWRTLARAAYLRSFRGANGRAEGSGILDRASGNVARISSNEAGGAPYPASERIFYSRDSADSVEKTTKKSPWLDASNRAQFAPGAWLYDQIGKAAGPMLVKLGLKAASPELRRQLRQMKIDVEKAQETALAIARETSKLSDAERTMVSDLVEQELKAGVIPPEHAVRLAAMINQAMGSQTDELVSLGMLTKDSADKWRGKYLPRYYASKLQDKLGNAWADAIRRLNGRQSVMKGIKGKNLKGRGLYETIPESQLANYEALGWEVRDPDYNPSLPSVDGTVQVWRDFTPVEREKMGEIRDAGFRFVMGYMQTQRDIALGRMFERMALDPEQSSRLEKEGYVQVPATVVSGTGAKVYGKLAGRWVPTETMSQLSNIEESTSAAWQVYRKAMAIWKEGKTALNPVSHVNNMVSNLTMAHLAGVSYHRGDKYIAAARDFVKKSPMMQEAKENGLFLGTLSDSELMNSLPDELKLLAQKQESKGEKAARTGFNILTMFLRKPMGAAYQSEDTFFRFLIYKDAREHGMEPQDAVDYAQKYIFTYDDLPKGARRIRDFGLPFFSYTYKAIPALLHTALTHPLRMAGPAAVLWAVNAAAYAIAAGDDDDSWEESLQKYLTDPDYREKAREKEKLEREHLPPWMKGTTALMTPKTLRLGMDEVTKLPLFIDISRIIPGGDLFDISPNAGGIPLPQPITPSHPIFTTMVAMLGNKDLFLGKDLVDNNDTRGEATEKRAAWLWRQMTPAITAGNYHWERGMNALAQANDGEITWLPDVLGGDATGIGRDGNPVQAKYAAMQTFGIKVRPIDLDTAEAIDGSMKKKMLRDIDTELNKLKRLASKGAISQRTLEKERDLAQTKKERLREGLTVDGDEKE